MTSNLALIERAITFACGRYGLDRDHAEEVSSTVKLRLVENDYAILRAYEQRSSFRTYISMVVQRMVLDYQNHVWGKWHASAEARRMGEMAVELEQLLHRDGRTFDETASILEKKHGASRESLRELAARLPGRAPKRRQLAIEDAPPLAAPPRDAPQRRVVAREQRELAKRLSVVMAAIVDALPKDERLVFQLHFQGGMKMSEIARALQRDQKELYRVRDKRMAGINEQLLRAGFSPRDVLELIGSDEVDLDFNFGKTAARPSKSGDERSEKTPGDDSEDPE
jgi:RNA polymerase sigma factor (sigma-70 family)